MKMINKLLTHHLHMEREEYNVEVQSLYGFRKYAVYFLHVDEE